MRIDVHAHYFPTSYVDLLVGFGRPDLKGMGQADDFPRRLGEMDKAEVDVQILSAVGLDPILPDPEQALTAARFINDIYHGITIEHGGRFRAFGWLPLPHVEHAITEAKRCMDELGFVGVCMPCSFHERVLDDPAFDPVWAVLNERKAVIYIHPVGSHSCCHYGLKEFNLTLALGSPLQTAMAAMRVAYSNLWQRYPNLKFVFAVLGGMLPFVWPRVERNRRRAMERSAEKAVGTTFFNAYQNVSYDPKDPMSAFRQFWYDSSAQESPDTLMLAKKAYGADRILLGSDEIFASVTEVVSYIKDSEYLTAEEKTNILDHNAQAMLNLLPPTTPRVV